MTILRSMGLLFILAFCLILVDSFRPWIPRFQKNSIRWSEYAEETEYEATATGSPLKQLLVRFNCEEIDSDIISEMMFEVGVLSVSVEVEEMLEDVYNDEQKWGDLQKTRSWKSAVLRANIPSSFDSSSLVDMLYSVFEQDQLEITVADVEQKDWVTDVQKNWPPQVIGDLTVRFPWHNDDQVQPTTHQLILQGGAAFGTGDHPTTRLCCKWIQRNIQDQADKRLTLLDYGTGSGLLGLAALRYGAASAAGTDIDKDALVNAQMNCAMNGLHMDLFLASEEDCDSAEEQSISMLASRGEGFEFPSVSALEGVQFDLTVANILAPILISLAPTLAERTKPGGGLALSGLVQQQASRVMEVFSEYFSSMRVEEVEEDWVVITGIRKG